MSRDIFIESTFPNIGTNYKITSPQDEYHNCIAFAGDDYDHWWWPNHLFWPAGIPEEETLAAFIACYKSIGYEECGLNSDFEDGFEKVAIYTNPGGTPTHAAKQFANGVWKSKLGRYHDIEHTLEGISGWFRPNSYGNVAAILKRKINVDS
jgi:hypothetical protein